MAEAVAKLKQEPGGELQVSGSGDLIQTLLTHDLVDGFTLIVFPVLIGTGKRLFADGTIPGEFRLVDSTTTATGVVVSSYERVGALRTGAVGPEYEGQE